MDMAKEGVEEFIQSGSGQLAQNLGIPHTSLLYRWKAEVLGQEGKAASPLEARVRQLEEQLRRTERHTEALAPQDYADERVGVGIVGHTVIGVTPVGA